LHLTGNSPASNETGVDTTPYRAAYIWSVAVAAALGGLLFGYDWVVIGGAKPFYEAYFHLDSQRLVGWANSCALLGCLLGSILAGWLSDSVGRKNTLLASGFLFAVTSALTGWAFSFHAFILWRIVGGLAIGLASNVSPTYIAEMSPAPWRGRLVSLNQLSIVTGILCAQIANWLIARKVPDNASRAYIEASWNAHYGWRWMFTAVCLPAVIFFTVSLFIPESPRWLIARGRKAEAERVLGRVGGDAYAARELLAIRTALESEVRTMSSLRTLIAPRFRRILLIGVGLAVLQQWSGINILFNYAEEVYRSAGYGISGLLFNIIVTGSINLIFTLLAMALVDRFGRRFLMLFGCIGVGLAQLLAGMAYRSHLQGTPILILTLSAIACYAVSLAPVAWVLIAEIFPNHLRSAGVAASVSALWTASFVLTYTFPLLTSGIGISGTFFLYGGVCLIGAICVFLCIPETKGRTLEQIELEFSAPRGPRPSARQG
jgi:SP family xylose:H+ symportor-like MFS transporter